MRVSFLVAGVLIVINAAIATAAWVFLSKHATRQQFARVGGALLGAVAGAWLAGPELSYVSERMCEHLRGDLSCDWSFLVPVLFVYPFSLPVTTGLCAWLLAEIIGGRGSKPLFTLGLTISGAVLGAALVFLPLYFIPGVERVLPRPIREPVAAAVPVLGALLALVVAHRSVTRLGEQKQGLTKCERE